MWLSIFLSALIIHTNNGFVVPRFNKITHNNALAKRHDISKLPTILYAVQDETKLEDTARNLFNVYCNEEKSMDWKALMDVPFVKDLLVSYSYSILALFDLCCI